MDKFYYMSPNGGVRDSDGELYHGIGDWFKKDAKYIKREWKNGKWVYTYKNDSSANRNKDASSKKQDGGSTIDRFKTGIARIKQQIEKTTGITDRKEYKDAEKKYESVKRKAEERKTEYDNVRDKAYEDNDLTDREKTSIAYQKGLYERDSADYEKAGEAFIKERDEYFETPIGKVATAIDKAADWLSGLFGKSEGEKQYEEDQKKAKEYQEELDRQKKGEYAEAQTIERNGIRTSELKGLLEKLNEPDTWLDKLLNKSNNPLPEFSLKQSATTLDDDMSLVNPNYTTAKTSYDENCGACSITYELRRRGYDVEVVSEDIWHAEGGTVGDLVDCFKNAKVVTSDAIQDKYDVHGNMAGISEYMNRDILSHGEGARGNINFQWTQGGGHSIAWEVENGKVIYRDCQTNQKIDINDYASMAKSMNYIRTDDLELTEECYKYARNRKG